MASMVGAPRILQALASFGVVPASRWLTRRAEGSDEPRYAILLSFLDIRSGLFTALAEWAAKRASRARLRRLADLVGGDCRFLQDCGEESAQA